jgi:hypothetical protein
MLAVIAYLLGDQIILRVSNNTIATTVDFLYKEHPKIALCFIHSFRITIPLDGYSIFGLIFYFREVQVNG